MMRRWSSLRRSLPLVVAVAAGRLLLGCSIAEVARQPTGVPAPVPKRTVAPTVVPPPEPAGEKEAEPAEPDHIVAAGKEFVIVAGRPTDTFGSLAHQFLGDSRLAWMIADFDGGQQLVPGREVVIPLAHPNPIGVYRDGYQTVPILCYHRFGNEKAKMFVSPQSFAEQMAFLADQDFRVIPLADLLSFLNGTKPLPMRSVVITIDDGYRSAYDVAYPILRAHGFPATIFVYTDFVGAKAGLRWSEMREMVDSGLIDIQPHSKRHSNMSFQGVAEGDEDYRERIAQEIAVPSREIRDKLGVSLRTFAYPYGDSNEFVIASLRLADYRLGVTVYPGGNPAFAYPYMLRRTMVFGQDDLTRFREKLEVFRDTD